jgi:hypothetical protein
MRRPVIAGIAFLALVLGLWTALHDTQVAQAQSPGTPPPSGPPAQTPPPGGPPPGGMQRPPGGTPMPVATDSFAQERDSIAKEVLRSIAGKENMPAESVFKNIKIMKGVPAGRLVNIMNMGYGRSLGARCKLCHIQDHWDADDKEEKATARMMMAMNDTLNRIFLSRIKHRDGSQAFAGCGTCHRGHAHPQRF